MRCLGVAVFAALLCALGAASPAAAGDVTVSVNDTPFPTVWMDVIHTSAGDSTTGGVGWTLSWATTTDADGKVEGTARSGDDLWSLAFSGSSSPAANGIDWGRIPSGCPARASVCSGKLASPLRVIEALGAGIDVHLEGSGFVLEVSGNGWCGQTSTSQGTKCGYAAIWATNPTGEEDVDVTGTAVVTDIDTGAALARIPLHAFFLKYIPYAASPPTISGKAQTGQALAAKSTFPTSGALAADSLAYAWERCDAGGGSCSTIPGATGETYVPSADDLGQTLRVVVTGATDGGSWPATSDATAPVVAGPKATPPAATGSATSAAGSKDTQPVTGSKGTPPAVSGTAAVKGTLRIGGTLTAAPGDWSGANVSVSYRWQKCKARCVAIPHATSPRLRLTKSLRGWKVRVVVTARNSAGVARSVSRPTRPVG